MQKNITLFISLLSSSLSLVFFHNDAVGATYGRHCTNWYQSQRWLPYSSRRYVSSFPIGVPPSCSHQLSTNPTDIRETMTEGRDKDVYHIDRLDFPLVGSSSASITLTSITLRRKLDSRWQPSTWRGNSPMAPRIHQRTSSRRKNRDLARVR